MSYYLTVDDERNFGPELLDVATRAARQAMAPELQQLHEQNQHLHDQLASTKKMAIDQYLDTHVPGWREINRSEKFHAWLLAPEIYSGVVRDRLLKDAAAKGDAARVASFFTSFIAAGNAPADTAARAATPSRKPTYTRGQILEMARMRRQGQIPDPEWLRWEHELVAAGREGRIIGALDPAGR
jgi:hypothetical protein